ncbi:glycosyltransferase family 2 protein [Modestobacter altitudinis]|uniref:glycosyltransferase family 2 protein n=1 Tax=Modestobacter altitudinis TaxID=2213158 RepID=UPI00110D067A|nr:glycosyltransferase family 2 protein [Modestobacter altitudinis]
MPDLVAALSLDAHHSESHLSTARVWPSISVVMPVLNEAKHLAESVGEILAQQYAGEVELIVCLGPSRDGTELVAHRLAAADPRIKLVRNPTGKTPAGLNIGLLAASHDIVARVDGHGVLRAGYLEQAVLLLEATGAANVGGLMLAVGQTGFERAVAKAYCSPVGLGGGTFHVGGTAGPAESVYLGVFRREVLQRLGGFNEHYHRAQDWELNHRIRQAGELVWFSPDLGVTYRPRSSWMELVRQFHATGRWRREVIRQYPGTVSPRYLAPPLAVCGILAGMTAGVVGLLTGVTLLTWGWVVPAAYAAGVLVASLVEGRSQGWRARAWLPVVLATIHLSWGAGFAFGRRPGDLSRPCAG